MIVGGCPVEGLEHLGRGRFGLYDPHYHGVVERSDNLGDFRGGGGSSNLLHRNILPITCGPLRSVAGDARRSAPRCWPAQRTQRAVPATPGSSFGNRSTCRFPVTPDVEKRRQKIQGKLIGKNHDGLEIYARIPCSRNVALIHIKATVVSAYSFTLSHERRDG